MCSDKCPGPAAVTTTGLDPQLCYGLKNNPYFDELAQMRQALGASDGDKYNMYPCPEEKQCGVAADLDNAIAWSARARPWEERQEAAGLASAVSATLRTVFLQALAGGTYAGCVKPTGSGGEPSALGSDETLSSCAVAARSAGHAFFGRSTEVAHAPDNCVSWKRRPELRPVSAADCAAADGDLLLYETRFDEFFGEFNDADSWACGEPDGGSSRSTGRRVPWLCVAELQANIRMDVRRGVKKDNVLHDFAALRATVTRSRIKESKQSLENLVTVEEEVAASLHSGPIVPFKPGAGKSGSKFMHTTDGKFFFKTLAKKLQVCEKESLKVLLKHGLAEIHAVPGSFLVRSYDIAKIDLKNAPHLPKLDWIDDERRYMMMEDANGGLLVPNAEQAQARGIVFEDWMKPGGNCRYDFYDIKGLDIRSPFSEGYTRRSGEDYAFFSKEHGGNEVCTPKLNATGRPLHKKAISICGPETECDDEELCHFVAVGTLPLSLQQCQSIGDQMRKDLSFLADVPTFAPMIDYSFAVGIRQGDGCPPEPECTERNRCFASPTKRNTWVTLGVIDYLNSLGALKKSESLVKNNKFSDYKGKMLKSLTRMCPGINDHDRKRSEARPASPIDD